MIESSLLSPGPTILDCRWLCGGALWWGFEKEVEYRSRDYPDFFHSLSVAVGLGIVATLLIFISIPSRLWYLWLVLCIGIVVLCSLIVAVFSECGKKVTSSCWALRVSLCFVTIVTPLVLSLLWMSYGANSRTTNGMVLSELPADIEVNATWHTIEANYTLQSAVTEVPDAELWWWAWIVSVCIVGAFPRIGVCSKLTVMIAVCTVHIFALVCFGEPEYRNRQGGGGSVNVTYRNGMIRFFDRDYHSIPVVPWWVISGLQMAVLVSILSVIGAQTEARSRTHHTWSSRVAVEQEEVETTRGINKLLLENILPAHLAHRFLVSSQAPQDLYHERYNSVGVMFASIPNYKEFYDETDVNKQGLECLRLLNEIICDYDKLLSKPKYSIVEKIKTIGSTYMVAAGLQPGKEEVHDRTEHSLVVLVEFAIALAGVLDAINKESFQNFKLRVGLAHGPVVAGVVGAQKPQYDIWGNTVNVASRMDSSGLMGRIQVTDETAQVLMGAGWTCHCRGPTQIKGKGTLITYFVQPPTDTSATDAKNFNFYAANTEDCGALLRHAMKLSSRNTSNQEPSRGSNISLPHSASSTILSPNGILAGTSLISKSRTEEIIVSASDVHIKSNVLSTASVKRNRDQTAESKNGSLETPESGSMRLQELNSTTSIKACLVAEKSEPCLHEAYRSPVASANEKDQFWDPLSMQLLPAQNPKSGGQRYGGSDTVIITYANNTAASPVVPGDANEMTCAPDAVAEDAAKPVQNVSMKDLSYRKRCLYRVKCKSEEDMNYQANSILTPDKRERSYQDEVLSEKTALLLGKKLSQEIHYEPRASKGIARKNCYPLQRLNTIDVPSDDFEDYPTHRDTNQETRVISAIPKRKSKPTPTLDPSLYQKYRNLNSSSFNPGNSDKKPQLIFPRGYSKKRKQVFV